MSKERLYLFDTTLRDGQQMDGVDFTLADKLKVMRLLDELGVDYVEGGYPGANPTDTALFAEKRTMTPKFTAFGMTKRAGRSASNDPGLAQTLAAKADAICMVAKSSAYQVRVALGVKPEENLASIKESVEAAKATGREVLIDCEHFFDGYKDDPKYTLSCAKAAYDAGARWIVLCDTNGGTLPHEIEKIVGEVVKLIPGDHVGIHAHNDTEQAVANSLAAVRAGARQIQGTLNGVGERCGNANLCSIIPTLLLKDEYTSRFEVGVKPEQLAHLTHAAHTFDEMLNRAPDRHAPYVGASLEVMDQDSRLMRNGKPFLFTNCKTGEGIDELVRLIEATGLAPAYRFAIHRLSFDRWGEMDASTEAARVIRANGSEVLLAECGSAALAAVRKYLGDLSLPILAPCDPLPGDASAITLRLADDKSFQVTDETKEGAAR